MILLTYLIVNYGYIIEFLYHQLYNLYSTNMTRL